MWWVLTSWEFQKRVPMRSPGACTPGHFFLTSERTGEGVLKARYTRPRCGEPTNPSEWHMYIHTAYRSRLFRSSPRGIHSFQSRFIFSTTEGRVCMHGLLKKSTHRIRKDLGGILPRTYRSAAAIPPIARRNLASKRVSMGNLKR